MQDRLRPKVLHEDHVGPGQIRRRRQLREVNGVGEVAASSNESVRSSSHAGLTN